MSGDSAFTPVSELNWEPVRPGRYVLYRMQRGQRAIDNHALEYAIRAAHDCAPTTTTSGLKRKFKMEEYERKVAELRRRAGNDDPPCADSEAEV